MSSALLDFLPSKEPHSFVAIKGTYKNVKIVSRLPVSHNPAYRVGYSLDLALNAEAISRALVA
jgi:hypothetical protein